MFGKKESLKDHQHCYKCGHIYKEAKYGSMLWCTGCDSGFIYTENGREEIGIIKKQK